MNRHHLAAAQLKARIAQPRAWEIIVMALAAMWIGFILATGGQL